MRLVIAGPCGVGKSVISLKVAEQCGIVYLDFDEIGRRSFEERKGEISPCSVSYLDLEKCIKPTLDVHAEAFILDIGGSTVFRPGVNNDDRLSQIIWLKNSYNARVMLITADKNTVLNRFLVSKGRKFQEFGPIWDSWVHFEKPYWELCADMVLDTTSFELHEVDEGFYLATFLNKLNEPGKKHE